MSAFERLGDMAPIDIWEGVLARTVDGDNCSIGIVELDPGSHVAEHSHPNEQLGLVVRGSVRFRVDNEERELGPGDTWNIRPNVPHEVHTGPEGAVVIDVFSPPRADWQTLERTSPRASKL